MIPPLSPRHRPPDNSESRKHLGWFVSVADPPWPPIGVVRTSYDRTEETPIHSSPAEPLKGHLTTTA